MTLSALYYPEIDPPLAVLRKFALFYDSILSFGPEDENLHLSNDTKAFIDSIPGSFEQVKPPDNLYEIFDDKANLVLEKGFSIIAEERNHQIPGVMKFKHGNTIFQMTDVMDEQDRKRIRNCAYIHNSKLSSQTKDLLSNYNLIHPDYLAQSVSLEWENFTIIEERASNLILSHIADYAASKKGWDTITCNELKKLVSNLH